MNQLERCQPAASAKERSEPAGTYIEKRAGEIQSADEEKAKEMKRRRAGESADDALCVDNQSQDPVASYSGSRRKQQQHPVESLYESAVAMNTVASFAYPVASSTHPVASFGIQTQEKKK
ncbi:hypothetical protein F511_43352 [Dorcoceras hygrometricum]|uniref:Uncharacterized protein n=1 Tax=Dorcoceras hygrometricum TaxID=472368 RepID=A0A2Z6ZZ06_9LAMI|nr:hypothetical protein F511_43352 [Dorcoceras hygrometricum]